MDILEIEIFLRREKSKCVILVPQVLKMFLNPICTFIESLGNDNSIPGSYDVQHLAFIING
jgi:hypothetical protein